MKRIGKYTFCIRTVKRELLYYDVTKLYVIVCRIDWL